MTSDVMDVPIIGSIGQSAASITNERRPFNPINNHHTLNWDEINTRPILFDLLYIKIE